MSLRVRSVLRAAERYAESCKTFAGYMRSAPDNIAARDWSDEFRTEYDEKLQDVLEAKETLLRLAQKL